MSLFTEKERADLCYAHDNDPEKLFDATVAAVLEKLAAGVSVEPKPDGYDPMSDQYLYKHDKFTAAIAAARVQENERIAQWYQDEGWMVLQHERVDAIRALLGKEAT